MPADLVTGHDAHDVAAYVAQSVAAGGEDTGLLATAVKRPGGKPAVEKNGTLPDRRRSQRPARLRDQHRDATPGQLTVKMANKSTTPHDIVIDGKGKGEIVNNGGTSQFSADFKAGTYTFYCSVPGHRAAGMEGTLTVK